MNDAHPLFPARTETEDPPEVVTINVARWEHNQVVHSPKRFAADELQDLGELAELYGGGKYELIARNHRHITARQVYVLPGKPKPLSGEPPEESQQPAFMQQQQRPPGGGSVGEWLMAAMPLAVQWLQGQQQMQAQQLQQNSQMLQVMLQQSTNSSREYVQSMQQLHNNNMQQLAQVLTAKAGGGADGSGFMRGAEWMQEFLAGQLEGAQQSGNEAEQQTIQQVLQGLQMLMQMKDGNAPNAPNAQQPMPQNIYPPGAENDAAE